MLIKEFRVVLPMSVEEYKIGQLWSVAEASRNETGGGDGVQVLENKSYTNKPLLAGQFSEGQYTKKKYFLKKKVSGFVRTFAPESALILGEEAWNAFPYCKTIITNEYFGDKFQVVISSHHLPGPPNSDNVHQLPHDKLQDREVIIIDIAGQVLPNDYNAAEDPTKFKSTKTGRGPLAKGWMSTTQPIMTAYKLVTIEFNKFGLQTLVEKKFMQYEERIFARFHRQCWCWIDQWYGLTMDDIRQIENSTQSILEKQRAQSTMHGNTLKD